MDHQKKDLPYMEEKRLERPRDRPWGSPPRYPHQHYVVKPIFK